MRAAILDMAKRDASLVEIVRRQFKRHLISREDTDMVLPHLSGRVGYQLTVHKKRTCSAHSKKQARAQKVKFNNSIDAPARTGDPDIHWLSYRGGRVSERSY